MDHQQGPTVEQRELCSVLCGSPDGGWEGGGRRDTCVYMTELLCCAPETITALLISCTPI